MVVCHTVLQQMPRIEDWQHFSRLFPSIPALLQAQKQIGMQPVWIGFAENAGYFEFDGIEFYQIETNGSLFGGTNKTLAQTIKIFENKAPAVIHQHGLNKAQPLLAIGKWAQKNDVPFIVQDHGGGMPQNRFRRHNFKKALSCASAVVFGDVEAGTKWLDAGILAKHQLVSMFAASSTFKPANETKRIAIREKLGMRGSPIFGWVGHLDENKDPLTILRAFSFIINSRPESQLYFHFQKDQLLQACQQIVESCAQLKGRVHFLGARAHADLEEFYQGIDYFVQGSHHEAYGFSVAEAMATGAIPIVTSIPSFRLLCRNGEIGYSFEPGDVDNLTAILNSLPTRPDEAERRRVAEHFSANFSYSVLAAKLKDIYKAKCE